MSTRAPAAAAAALCMADFTTPLPQAGATSNVGGVLGDLKGLLSKEWWTERARALTDLSRAFFNPLEFSRPASQSEWLARVPANAARFAPVYGCFFLPILLRTMLSSWWLRIGSLLLLSLWAYAYLLKKEEAVLFVCGAPVPKVIACSVASVVVMLGTGMLNALIGALFVFSVVAMPHMSLHHAPSGADAMDAVELQTLAGK